MNNLKTASVIKRLLMAAGAFSLVVAFQNCSKIQPSILTEDVSGKVVDVNGDGIPDVDQGGDVAVGDGEDQGDDGGAKDVPKSDVQVKADLLANCDLARKSLVSASGDLTNLRGNVFIKADSLGVVSDIRGNLVIAPDKAATVTITSAENIRGNIILCSAVVGQAVDIAGNLKIVNSTIGSISEIRGNVISYHSKINDLSNFRGNIKEIQ